VKGSVHPTHAEDNGADIPAGRPKFPRTLTPEAKAVFKLLVRQLEARRACTAGDMQILHVFAEVHVRWVNARSKIAELGEVVVDTRLDGNGGAHEVLAEKPLASRSGNLRIENARYPARPWPHAQRAAK
jgi:hypothetical protein